MNMKSLLKIIHTVIIAVIVLHSCNNEVFISDFTPSVSEVQLSEKDPVSEIYFESSNWDIQSVYDMDENGNYNEIKGDIYGPDGSLMEENSSLYTNGLGQVK